MTRRPLRETLRVLILGTLLGIALFFAYLLAGMFLR